MTLETNPALTHTEPGNRGVCGFCGQEEGGYAKKNPNGAWKASCWKCVKPVGDFPQPKRKPVGSSLIVADADADIKPAEVKKKAPGMAPSTHRPKVS